MADDGSLWIESGVYAGMLYGFLESVWNTPPTPIPSEVVVLKAPPKSDWARKTATTMATRGGMAGVSMATFVLTKNLSASYFGEESTLSYTFGGACGGAVFALRHRSFKSVPLNALFAAAGATIFSMDTTKEDLHHLEEHHYARGPRRA